MKAHIRKENEAEIGRMGKLSQCPASPLFSEEVKSGKARGGDAGERDMLVTQE